MGSVPDLARARRLELNGTAGAAPCAPCASRAAVLAEASGWDGVFVWEAAYGVDAWSLLAAIAVRTAHVTIGTLLTPLPWRRPWKVASQVATVDRLSGGRAVLTGGSARSRTTCRRRAR